MYGGGGSLANDMLQQGARATLDNAVEVARRCLLSCWQGVRKFSVEQTSNFHAATHVGEILDLYGLPRPCSAARGEAKHGAIRSVVSHSNHKIIEFDALQNDNVKSSISFLIAAFEQANMCGYPPGFLDLVRSQTSRVLVARSGKTATYVMRTNEGVEGHDCPVRFQSPIDTAAGTYERANLNEPGREVRVV